MVCEAPRPKYIPHSEGGILTAISRGDGNTIGISWFQAYPDKDVYKIAYNIYFSTEQDEIFKEGIKFVSIQSDLLTTNIIDLTPGDNFYFAVRAFEYRPEWYDLSLLPDSGSSKVYPESILLQTITNTSDSIYIADINEFPSYGIVKIGKELILYTNKDIPTSSLTGLTRGFLSTEARSHEPNGFDGYEYTTDPLVKFWKGFEEPNTVVFQETSAFSYPNFPRTALDGYKVGVDLLTTNLSASDASQADFPVYDYVGWHRTDPVALLRGDCVGTYYGGERFCADGYDGVGRQIRGIPFEDANHQREEVLLELTGEPCVLVRLAWTNVRCACYQATTEHPEDRCPLCMGKGYLTSYNQFFNPRRSDGRILVRFDPTKDDLRMDDGGLESSFIPNCWTLVFPAIKDRDFIIRFNEDGTEEFRYEILDVTRNKLLNSLSGRQTFTAQRVRKFDPINQWRAINDTSTIPAQITTGIGMVPGPGGIPPHTHTITISEKITTLAQINQTTSVSPDVAPHNHPVINGVVQEILGHDHQIILP